MSTSFNYGISLPVLADSSSMAAVAPARPDVGLQLLDLQLKLHLLTSEHVLISHGFLYDNPALWSLLGGTLARRLAESPRMGGRSTLIVQMDQAAQAFDAKADPDALFRVWAFGPDGTRHLEPSAPRALGNDPAQALGRLKRLDATRVTVEEYALALELPGLSRAKGEIVHLLANCTRESRVTDRHRAFLKATRAFVDRLSAMRASRVPNGPEHLYEHIDELTRLINVSGTLSRSMLERQNRELWWKLAPYLNHYRLRAYLPEHDSPSMSFLPGSNGEAISRIVQDSRIEAGDVPQWAIALQKLEYDAIFEMRAKGYFRQKLETLGAMRLSSDTAYREYVRILEQEWAPALEQAASECAKHAIVQRPLKDAKWVNPAASLTGAGFGVAAATLAGAQAIAWFGAKNAAVAAAAIAPVSTAVVTLSILAARGIWSRFRVDTPEKSAHLVAARMVEEFGGGLSER